MKPQCETAADCLEQLARVMRQFGISNTQDALQSDYVKYLGVNVFFSPKDWKFAIAEVEGKPVFLGDTMFTLDGDSVIIEDFYTQDDKVYLNNINVSRWTWNPPNQTVLIKIDYGDPVEVEKAARIIAHGISTLIDHETFEAAEQFREAMKPLVKEPNK